MKQNLGLASVSQRDLQRVFKLLAFFISHHRQRQHDYPDSVPEDEEALIHRSLLLSIAVAYYFRLDRDMRHSFLLEMAQLDGPHMAGDESPPCYDMACVVEYELDLFTREAQLPPGIAPNEALRENFFCIAVCIATKTPLIIVGTPGWCTCMPCFEILAEHSSPFGHQYCCYVCTVVTTASLACRVQPVVLCTSNAHGFCCLCFQLVTTAVHACR